LIAFQFVVHFLCFAYNKIHLPPGNININDNDDDDDDDDEDALRVFSYILLMILQMRLMTSPLPFASLPASQPASQPESHGDPLSIPSKLSKYLLKRYALCGL